MKIIVSLLAFLLLINCYSYRRLNPDNGINEEISSFKTYELSLTNKTKIIVRDLRLENQNYWYKDKRNREKSIPVSMVLIIRERDFSWGKTIGLILGNATVFTVLAVVAVSNVGIPYM